VKLRPKIETHDYETKARMAERLLLDGSKVKVTIMFRGREITYTGFGKRLLDRIAEDLSPIALVEREARLEGKNMFLILAPRPVPTGPPKFSHLAHLDAQSEAERNSPPAGSGTKGDDDGDETVAAAVPKPATMQPAEPAAKPEGAITHA
jgi:translation initiation factor IF-3